MRIDIVVSEFGKTSDKKKAKTSTATSTSTSNSTGTSKGSKNVGENTIL